MVPTAEGREEMDAHPLKKLREAEKTVKGDQAIEDFHHFTNTIQKEAKVRESLV